jgi:hypothetical protein
VPGTPLPDARVGGVERPVGDAAQQRQRLLPGHDLGPGITVSPSQSGERVKDGAAQQTLVLAALDVPAHDGVLFPGGGLVGPVHLGVGHRRAAVEGPGQPAVHQTDDELQDRRCRHRPQIVTGSNHAPTQ